MAPTDVANPQYFHKVVDCQWACPTHTPVPEYIRLITQGRYAPDAQLSVAAFPLFRDRAKEGLEFLLRPERLEFFLGFRPCLQSRRRCCRIRC